MLTNCKRQKNNGSKGTGDFFVVDELAVLADQRYAAKYWSVLKTRLKKECGELTTNCSQLKMRLADGKRYNTDVADTEQLFRSMEIPVR